MNVWVTSDFHLGHANIIRYCDRPFATVGVMDDELIRRFNERVADEDLVWILGDFAFAPPELYASRLRGRLRIVLGNHDKRWRKSMRACRRFETVLEGPITWTHGEQTYFLDHYPRTEWQPGHVHLHGHSHCGKSRPAARLRGRLDVGVDCHEYAPILLEDAAWMAKRW